MDPLEIGEGNLSWIMILLLICLAGALALVAFGFGAINLADARLITTPDPQILEQLQGTDEGPIAQDLAALARYLQELQDQIGQEERTVKEVQSMVADKMSVPVDQIYGRTGSGKAPQWVECLQGGVILQPQGEQISLLALVRNPHSFLQAIRQKGYVVFLVRPQGFKAFEEARRLAVQAGVTLGYEPVDEGWVLHFGGGKS